MTDTFDRAASIARGLAGLADELAQTIPQLARGQVWCRSCGATLKVDAAACLRSGWPTCCGATMTIDETPEAG